MKKKIDPTLMNIILTLFGVIIMLLPLVFLLNLVREEAETSAYILLTISSFLVVLTSMWNNGFDLLEDLKLRSRRR